MGPMHSLRSPLPPVRIALLALVLLSGTAVVRLLAGPPLERLLSVTHAGVAPSLPALVSAACAVMLLACWAWCLIATGAVVVDVLRTRPDRATSAADSVRCPRLVAVVVVSVLGVGYGAAPSLAHGGSDPRTSDSGADAPTATGSTGFTGLRLPDRPVTSGPCTSVSGPTDPGAPTPVATVRVRAGDSLWSMSRQRLPNGASIPEVRDAWLRLMNANADVLGTDPDLIFPGTLLRVPDNAVRPWKDRR